MTEVAVSREAARWRLALVLDLGLYNVAVFFFALLPPSTLWAPEQVACAVSTLALAGLVCHALPCRLPGTRLAYAATAWVGAYTLTVYALLANDVPGHVKVPYMLFLLAGIVSAMAAHLIDGRRCE